MDKTTSFRTRCHYLIVLNIAKLMQSFKLRSFDKNQVHSGHSMESILFFLKLSTSIKNYETPIEEHLLSVPQYSRRSYFKKRRNYIVKSAFTSNPRVICNPETFNSIRETCLFGRTQKFIYVLGS